jgi:hypothetical protein
MEASKTSPRCTLSRLRNAFPTLGGHFHKENSLHYISPFVLRGVKPDTHIISSFAASKAFGRFLMS